MVTSGQRLLEVGDPTDLEVEIDVLSTDAAKVRPGTKVFFERWGGDEALRGRVRRVEPAAFTKVSALGVEEQRDGWAVFVAAGGRAPLRSREVGQTNGLESEVVAGLEAGAKVVLHPSDRIDDGVRIEPR